MGRSGDRPVGERDQETPENRAQLPQEETQDGRSNAKDTPEGFAPFEAVNFEPATFQEGVQSYGSSGVLNGGGMQNTEYRRQKSGGGRRCWYR
jgi:hypothetical protein